LGTYLGWLTLRARSVWPAVIANAVANALGGLSHALMKNEPSPLLAPPLGLFGALGFGAVALWILFSPGAFPQREEGES